MSVYPNFTGDQCYGIARGRHAAFDKRAPRSKPGLPEDHNFPGPGPGEDIGKFAHDDTITREERGFHGAGRDPERLEDKRAEEKCSKSRRGDDQRAIPERTQMVPSPTVSDRRVLLSFDIRPAFQRHLERERYLMSDPTLVRRIEPSLEKML
jgi:hypothetical protein